MVVVQQATAEVLRTPDLGTRTVRQLAEAGTYEHNVADVKGGNEGGLVIG